VAVLNLLDIPEWVPDDLTIQEKIVMEITARVILLFHFGTARRAVEEGRLPYHRPERE
jgi:hypothetical protein